MPGHASKNTNYEILAVCFLLVILENNLELKLAFGKNIVAFTY